MEYDLERPVPAGWSSTQDGSTLCPRCAAAAAEQAAPPPQ
jgi:hypothetical protein